MTILEQHYMECVISIQQELHDLTELLSKIIEVVKDDVKSKSSVLQDSTPLSDHSIMDSSEAAMLLKDNLDHLDHEELWILIVNAANVPLKKVQISIGDLTATVIDKRRIVREVIEANGKSVIMAHNHPSQNPRPSAEDIRITSELRDCLKLFDFELIDHIVFCKENYYSFSDNRKQKYSK